MFWIGNRLLTLCTTWNTFRSLTVRHTHGRLAPWQTEPEWFRPGLTLLGTGSPGTGTFRTWTNQTLTLVHILHGCFTPHHIGPRRFEPVKHLPLPNAYKLTQHNSIHMTSYTDIDCASQIASFALDLFTPYVYSMFALTELEPRLSSYLLKYNNTNITEPGRFASGQFRPKYQRSPVHFAPGRFGKWPFKSGRFAHIHSRNGILHPDISDVCIWTFRAQMSCIFRAWTFRILR